MHHVKRLLKNFFNQIFESIFFRSQTFFNGERGGEFGGRVFQI